MRRPLSLVAVGAVALALSACGSQEGTASAADYSSGRVAPRPSELSTDLTDETPDPEEALVELELDSGSTAALWIDPEDIARVLVQYSDPEDPEAWTEPAVVYEGGAGCLTMDADTADTTVAVGLGCYEVDPFIQQAPDQGVALVSTDLETWEKQGVGESVPVPEVSEDGATVVFRNQVYDGEVDAEWERGEGF